jgi:peptidoglycan hydrolase-like protein with peptidoglycan-binding domain
LATRTPEADTPLLDLKTRDGAAAVQAKLKALGYYHRTVDGKWGPRSAAALSSFRQDKGLSSGGVWDLAAQSALLGK